MYLRGRLPLGFGIGFGTLVLVVLTLGVLPSFLGTAMVLDQTTTIFEEFTPTERDEAMADELEAYLALKGQPRVVTAQEIAAARALGELDAIERRTGIIFTNRDRAAEREAAAGRQAAAREIDRKPAAAVAEPATDSTLYLLIGLAGVLVAVAVGAGGYAAYTLLSPADADDGPDQRPSTSPPVSGSEHADPDPDGSEPLVSSTGPRT